MRKDNYAARVMLITPHRGAVTGNEARHTVLDELTSQVGRIDVWWREAYFSLRIRDVISDGKGATVKAGPKGRGSSPRRRTQSASRSCPRSFVQGQPVLRPQGILLSRSATRWCAVIRQTGSPSAMPPMSSGSHDRLFTKPRALWPTKGSAGLLPQQRGPKGGHKISVEVIAFVLDELKAENPDLTLPQVIGAIAVRFVA